MNPVIAPRRPRRGPGFHHPRTTGFSLAITGLMQVDGRITARGAHTPDEAVPFGPYVNELKKRGIEIREV